MRTDWSVCRSAALALAVLLGAATPLWAQPAAPLPDGHTLLSLTVTERSSVTEDTLVAALRFEDEGHDAAALQRRVNTAMQQALASLDAEEDIRVSTGRYAVYQVERQSQSSRRDVVWRGSQTVVLETRRAHERLQVLAGELQSEGFVISQLGYHLSNERRDEVRDTLLESAIARARARAERAGQALGRPQVEIAELNVDSEGDSSPMMMRSMTAESADGAAPSARPGETEVTLTVSIRAVAQQ